MSGRGTRSYHIQDVSSDKQEHMQGRVLHRHTSTAAQ